MRTRTFAAIALVIPLLAPAVARAEAVRTAMSDPSLRSEWSVVPTSSGRARVSGYLYNSNIKNAANVMLRVEQLAPDGGVTAAYRGRVIGDVFPNDRTAFDVPVASPGATYRVVVESVDWVDQCR